MDSLLNKINKKTLNNYQNYLTEQLDLSPSTIKTASAYWGRKPMHKLVVLHYFRLSFDNPKSPVYYPSGKTIAAKKASQNQTTRGKSGES